jgi:hypothetical protein
MGQLRRIFELVAEVRGRRNLRTARLRRRWRACRRPRERLNGLRWTAEIDGEGAERPRAPNGGGAYRPQLQVPIEGTTVPLKGDRWPLQGADVTLEGTHWPSEGAHWPLEGACWPLEGACLPLEGS